MIFKKNCTFNQRLHVLPFYHRCHLLPLAFSLAAVVRVTIVIIMEQIRRLFLLFTIRLLKVRLYDRFS